MSSQTTRITKTSEGSVHLDALRGLAALLVFLNHTRALYFSSLISPKTELTSSTQVTSTPYAPGPESFFGPQAGEVKLAGEAVVVFFVLSGYLVGGSVLRLQRTMHWSWRVYLTKRLTRIYVVLIPALLIGAALDYIGSNYFGAGSVYTAPAGLELVTTINLAARLHPLLLLANAFFLENFRVPYVGTNVALWSLANEFWYYLAFPMLALAVATSKTRASVRIAWGLGACAVMIFTGLDIALLFPIWILGAMISILPRTLSIKQAKLFSVAFTALLLAVMSGVRFLHMHTLPAYFLVALVASALLYVLVQQTQPARTGIYATVAGFFSRISYSLYLFHVPMAIFLCGLIDSPWHSLKKTPRNLALFAASDLLIIACVYGLWRLFEANTDALRIAVFERERRLDSKPTQ